MSPVRPWYSHRRSARPAKVIRVNIDLPEFVLLVAGIAVIVFLGIHWRRRHRE